MHNSCCSGIHVGKVCCWLRVWREAGREGRGEVQERCITLIVARCADITHYMSLPRLVDKGFV